MNIHIIRGENQIGGNIIEISTPSTRILLDAGLELDTQKNNTLPELPALFQYKGYDALFVTHYHSDHLGLAYHAHRDIPLYMGEASWKIVRASDAYKGVPTLSPAGFLRHREPISIGDMTVTPFLCDHSAFDSYMLLCEADGERVLYTGDFRSNGRKPYGWLLSQLPDKVDTLICEGTTLSREGYVPVTEQELEEQAISLLQNRKGPVFVLQSSMNIDRIVTMFRTAKRTGRVMLQELYLADITASIGGSIPNPCFEDVYPFITDKRRYEGLCKYRNRVGMEYITATPFIMCVRTSMLEYMKSLAKRMDFSGGLLIYSFWSGYRDTPEMKAFLDTCEAMGLTVVTLHTSGHADPNAIKRLIQKVKPSKILPVHTEVPQWFQNISI